MAETTACTAQEKRVALEKALGSRTFARSEQLKSFLRFVCDAEMNGRAVDLTEYLIGVEVLGRPPGYSPAEDSSVRTRAYELRQKLQKLYTTELAREPWRIEIAKGAYVPLFVKGAAVPPGVPGPPARTWLPQWPRRHAALGCAAIGGVAAGAALMFLSLRAVPSRPAVDPVLVEAWRPMARRDAEVALSVAAPLHLIVGPPGRPSHGLPMFSAPAETYPLYQQQRRPLTPGGRLEMTFTDNAIGFGTMNAVLSTVATLKSMGARYQVLPDRAAPISALRDRHAILFGNAADSQTIGLVMEDAPLFVDFDADAKSFVVRDRTSGRLLVPQPDGKGGYLDVYGLVTVLNTRDSEQGRLGMVIFSGSNSAGTNGAAEFFSSSRALRHLRSIFEREGIAGFPPAYQVVVKCTFGDLLMISYEYAGHRILRK